MGKLIIQKDGWVKERGALAQFFKQSFTFEVNKENNELTDITTEVRISEDFESPYGWLRYYITVDYSTVLAYCRYVVKSSGGFDPITRVQILELGRIRRQFDMDDNQEPAKFVKAAKKLCEKHIKADLEKYHRADYNHKAAWRIGYDWADHDKEFEEILGPEE